MEKMIIDLQDLPEGVYSYEGEFNNLQSPCCERLNAIYQHEWNPAFKPNITGRFEYEIKGGRIVSMMLEFKMNHQCHEDLEHLAMDCSCYLALDFELDEKEGKVYYKANNLLDMGRVLASTRLYAFILDGSVLAVVDEEPDIKEARRKWKGKYDADFKEQLRVAEACDNDKADDELMADDYIDEYKVRYSKDRKRLICAVAGFNSTEYFVPDGVEEICENAFWIEVGYLTLSVPRSVKCIAGNVFHGIEGNIVIRDV